MELLSAINGSSFYAEYAASAEKDSLGNTITSTYLTAVPSSVMDSNKLEYDSNDRISAYDGNTFVGPYVPLTATECMIGLDNNAEAVDFAQGNNNTAYVYSLAQGQGNSADNQSIAQGYGNSAKDFGQAFGFALKISGGMAIGYSNATTAARFVIGNGDKYGTPTAVNRSDLFVIDANGFVSGANFGTSAIPSIETAITALQNTVSNFGSYEVVASTGSIVTPDTKKIYLIKDTSVTGNDKYEEWICTNTATPTYEMIGTTEVDLSNYILTSTYNTDSAKWDDTVDVVSSNSATWGSVSSLTLSDIATSAGITNIVYSSTTSIPDPTAMDPHILYLFPEM